jgi:hypothetical protein
MVAKQSIGAKLLSRRMNPRQSPALKKMTNGFFLSGQRSRMLFRVNPIDGLYATHLVFAVAAVIVLVVEVGRRLPISSLRPHEQFLHAFLGFEAADSPSFASPQLGTEFRALTTGAPLSSSSSSTRPASCQGTESSIILAWAALGKKNVFGENQATFWCWRTDCPKPKVTSPPKEGVVILF